MRGRLGAALLVWLMLWAALAWPVDALAQADRSLSATNASFSEAGLGYIEEAHILDGRALRLKGWAAASHPSVFVTLARVWLGDQHLYTGRLGYASNRPDVAQAHGNPRWQTSGFELILRIPTGFEQGPWPIRMEVINGDGSHFDVRHLPGTEQVQWEPSARPSAAALTMLVLALAVPLLLLALPTRRQPQPLPSGWRRHVSARRNQFAAAMLAAFGLLVAGGWTGSSLQLVLDPTPMLEHDAAPLWGQPQTVRSDEWLVVTPLALSQRAQPQPFGALNPLHGLHGQNMNVVGMTGAPVANASLLAKPAVWGMVLLDLRQALAWNWWLPFFACFGALWVMLQRWFGTPWRSAAVLAATFALSPYSVSFSGWPAYVTAFPLAAALALDQLLRRSPGGAPRWWSKAAWGVLAGWAAAGFVLVLYPGWQIALAYLMLPLCLAYAWQTRAQRSLQPAQWLGLLLAAATTALLLGSWWFDAQEAIQTMQATVYPGQRSTEVGGYADPWALSKGLTNFVTMFQSSQWSIPSDAGSFVFVLLPLAVATMLVLVRRRTEAAGLPQSSALLWVLWAYTIFVVWFMLAGLPAWLSETSLWGRVPAIRLDVALGLAQTLLLGWLFGRYAYPSCPATDQPPDDLHGNPPRAACRSMAVVTAATGAGCAAFALWQHTLMPVPLQEWLTPGAVALSAGLAGLLGAWLVRRDHAPAALGLYAIWMLAGALPFNPLGQAPSHISVVPALQPLLQADASGQRPRVAVIQQNRWANALTTAGVSVLNTTFYDPPLRFWQQLDPNGRYTAQYNRYQHLGIFLLPGDASTERTEEGYTIAAPALDRVELRIDAARFDFRHIGADYVLANAADAEALRQNGGLRVAHQMADWALLRVVAPASR